ncbi:hypothetical protein [Cupriavidus sp. UYPR2.512]|uniref:hypothetical protein n=1 Tax=Cupriavidus sp. UYPR2.512 TaxID=1080187 RepID=UPI00036CE1D3|nr:hypothetical protein [Cupriavidus sp. UYPR2.512]UIF88237.1 hypothetical protein KAF44_20745 [Cupriavidus necator]
MTSLFRQIVKEHKLSAKLSPVFICFPELDDVCTRLVDFIGLNFIVRDEPLVKEMLMDALAGYKAERKDGYGNVAFMRGLFGRAHELYAKRYAAFKGEKYTVWAPFLEPIPLFEGRQAPGYVCRMVDEPCPEPITPRSAAFQLAARVLKGPTFRRYFEEYDVCGQLAHC